ncbi:MAG: hypothetical protein MKZ70_05850 [Opitutales bacterium]|nr:hypothetical protein [Opitutales bacterium]
MDTRKYNLIHLAGSLPATISLTFYLGQIGFAQILYPGEDVNDDSSLSSESMATYVL